MVGDEDRDSGFGGVCSGHSWNGNRAHLALKCCPVVGFLAVCGTPPDKPCAVCRRREVEKLLVTFMFALLFFTDFSSTFKIWSTVSIKKIPSPSHFQFTLCVLIRSRLEKFDNRSDVGPSFPWLLAENRLLNTMSMESTVRTD